MNRNRLLFLIFLFLIVVPDHLSVRAQNFSLNEVAFKVGSSSVISLVGKTTTGSFRCESNEVEGGGRAGRADEETGEPFIAATLKTPVAAFDCRNGKTTRGLHEALKQKVYPDLLLTITDGLARGSTEEEGGDYYLRGQGLLTIAGVEQPVDLSVIAEQEGFFTFRVEGSYNIKMSDFGIEPPTALLGLIKTDNRITVEFDLVLTPDFGF